jgi:hypothetical protein
MLYYSYSSVRESLSCVSSPLHRSSVLSISTRREHCMGQMTHLLTFYMKCIDLWPPNLQKREGTFRLWGGLVCCQRLCCSLFRAQSHFSSQKVLALRGIYQQPLMYMVNWVNIRTNWDQSSEIRVKVRHISELPSSCRFQSRSFHANNGNVKCIS